MALAWITFIRDLNEDEVQRLSSDASVGAVRASIERRITGELRLGEVAWATPFRMHRRLVSRLLRDRWVGLVDVIDATGSGSLTRGVHVIEHAVMTQLSNPAGKATRPGTRSRGTIYSLRAASRSCSWEGGR